MTWIVPPRVRIPGTVEENCCGEKVEASKASQDVCICDPWVPCRCGAKESSENG